MKILIFNWRDIKNPEAGGAEIYTHEIAKRLVNKGHEITLFTSEFKGCKKEEYIDGVHIIRSGGKYTVYFKAKKYYKKYFSKEKYDVIIDEINTRPFFAVDFAKNGERVIALIHQLAREFWFYETPFPISYIGYYWLENRWLKKYAKHDTITVSESTKKDLINLGFKRVYIVMNGLNVTPLDRLPVKTKNPTIIFVGRMKKAKRPQDVIKAFQIVKQKIPDAELWMVGDGYLRRKFEKKVISGIKFFGYVDNKTKNELVKRAWVLVAPGIREGWGQVVTDANALGTPAIAYDTHGLRDSIIDGVTGLLVKENGNVKKLADALITVLMDNALRVRLTLNALKHAKKFNWDNSAKEFLSIIQLS